MSLRGAKRGAKRGSNLFDVGRSPEVLKDSPRRHEGTKSQHYPGGLCRMAESVVDMPASWLCGFAVNLTCFHPALGRKRRHGSAGCDDYAGWQCRFAHVAHNVTEIASSLRSSQ